MRGGKYIENKVRVSESKEIVDRLIDKHKRELKQYKLV